MGLADWITGIKCVECGLKIQGANFSRVGFGSEMWVCSACEEKRKTERKIERDAAEQQREREEDAAFGGRSDADIARSSGAKCTP
jgi:ribosome-binding protein aMBF1 (putative translation factor)